MANPTGAISKQQVLKKISYHPEFQETIFAWKLENFNLRMGKGGTFLDSPCFSIDLIDATNFFLKLVHVNDKNEILSLQLHRHYDSGPPGIVLMYKFEIQDGFDTDGEPLTLTSRRGRRTFLKGTYRLQPQNPDYPASFVWERQLFEPKKGLFIKCHILPISGASQSHADEEDPLNVALSHELSLLYKDRICSDIVLCAGEERFRAHRSILCARSPTFAKELKKYSSDSKTIELKSELNAPVLEALLKYLYSGRLDSLILSLDYELYSAAVKYQVADLKWKLSTFPKRSFAHTLVYSEEKTFNWSLPGFGDTETMVKISSPLFTLEYHVPCSFDIILYITASTVIAVGNQTIPNVKISVRKVRSDETKLISLFLRLSVIDSARRFDISDFGYHVFTDNNNWEFPPFLNTYKLLSDRLNYLPNNTLSLLCEFIVSDGNCISHFESTRLDTFLQRPQDLRSFAMDIRDMYTHRRFSDVMLCAVDGKVPAHKSILVARCPILRTLLWKLEDLKEIQLAATVHAINKMLYYLYTGSEYPKLEDYKIAIELHILSSDLNLLNLKEYCKEYMMSILCAQNVRQILEFAEGHIETRMSVWLEEFINKHSEEMDEAARLELMLEYQRRRDALRKITKCTIL